MGLIANLARCWGCAGTSGSAQHTPQVNHAQLPGVCKTLDTCITPGPQSDELETSTGPRSGSGIQGTTVGRQQGGARHQQQPQGSLDLSFSSTSLDSLLGSGLLQSSPHLMTAISLGAGTGAVHQNPRSLSYFGELRERFEAGAMGTQGLDLRLLQQLFALEGKQVLDEMLEAVMLSGPGSSWSRVMRVPRQCHLAPMPATPAAIAAEQGAVGSSSGASQLCMRSSQDEAAPGGLASQHGPDARRSLTFAGGRLDKRRGNAGDVSRGTSLDISVAMRNAPQMIRSLVELSMTSGSHGEGSSRGSLRPSTGAPQSPALATARAPHVSCVRSYSVGGTHFGKRLLAAGPTGSCGCLQPQDSRQQHLCSTQSLQSSPHPAGQVEHACVLQGQHAASGLLSVPLPEEGQGDMSEIDSMCETEEMLAVLLDQEAGGSGIGSSLTSTDHADAAGSPPAGFMSMPQQLSMPQQPAAAARDMSTAAEVGRVRLLLRPVATPTSRLGGPQNTVQAAHSLLETAAEHEGTDGEGVGAFLWHDVRITQVEVAPDNRPALMVFQTDVTARTHLEVAMAGLTQAQLTTLTQIFPRHVVEHLSIGHGAIQASSLGQLACAHQDISVLFMDIVGFTTMSKQVPAAAVMTFLNHLFSLFDDLCAAHGVHKVETAGDCYIVSSGLMRQDKEGFFQVEQEHDPVKSAAQLFEFAKDMLASSRQVAMPHNGMPVAIRIGIHTGPCTSGVVGSKLPKFGLFGDTMNTASRMESTCIPGRIQTSEATHMLLLASGISDPAEWHATSGLEVKGKGVMQTFLWVEPASFSSVARTEADTGLQKQGPGAVLTQQQEQQQQALPDSFPGSADGGVGLAARCPPRKVQTSAVIANSSGILEEATMQFLSSSPSNSRPVRQSAAQVTSVVTASNLRPQAAAQTPVGKHPFDNVVNAHILRRACLSIGEPDWQAQTSHDNAAAAASSSSACRSRPQTTLALHGSKALPNLAAPQSPISAQAQAPLPSTASTTQASRSNLAREVGPDHRGSQAEAHPFASFRALGRLASLVSRSRRAGPCSASQVLYPRPPASGKGYTAPTSAGFADDEYTMQLQAAAPSLPGRDLPASGSRSSRDYRKSFSTPVETPQEHSPTAEAAAAQGGELVGMLRPSAAGGPAWESPLRTRSNLQAPMQLGTRIVQLLLAGPDAEHASSSGTYGWLVGSDG